MHGKDYLAIIQAASAERITARRPHKAEIRSFREGLRGPKYLHSLQMLISLLVNGQVPDGASLEFLIDVKPLVSQLLQKWEIGTLRQVFSKVPSSGLLNLPKTCDPLIVVVSRAEVEAMNTSIAMKVLKQLIESPDTAKAFVERVDIAFDGYNQTNQELFEIEAVRNFVYQLDKQFPYWLFFLSKRHLGLQCLLNCFLPPFLTEDARLRIFPERIYNLLVNHWFPAMNHMCKYVSFTEMQVKRLTERAVTYINSGRFPLDSERFA